MVFYLVVAAAIVILVLAIVSVGRALRDDPERQRGLGGGGFGARGGLANLAARESKRARRHRHEPS
ncbi:MAG TPA: hypothetical protein VF257_08985 [Solirubrobacteraceae bacterium]